MQSVVQDGAKEQGWARRGNIPRCERKDWRADLGRNFPRFSTNEIHEASSLKLFVTKIVERRCSCWPHAIHSISSSCSFPCEKMQVISARRAAALFQFETPIHRGETETIKRLVAALASIWPIKNTRRRGAAIIINGRIITRTHSSVP